MAAEQAISVEDHGQEEDHTKITLAVDIKALAVSVAEIPLIGVLA